MVIFNSYVKLPEGTSKMSTALYPFLSHWSQGDPIPKKTRPGGFEEPPLHGTAKLYGSTAAQLPSEKPGLLVPNFTHLLGFYFWIFLESFPGDFQVLQHVQYFHYSRPNFCVDQNPGTDELSTPIEKPVAMGVHLFKI